MRTKLSAQWLLWSLPVAVLALASWTTVSWAQEKKQEPAPKVEPAKKAEDVKAKDIADTVKATADLKTLYELIDAATLTAQLKEKGPFTLLAPTNEAFKKVNVEDLKKPANKEKLAKLIKNHIINGKVDLVTAKNVKTMADTELPVDIKDGVTTIGGAKVGKTPTMASNGVILTVDKVLTPAEKPAEKAPAEPPKKPEAGKDKPEAGKDKPATPEKK